eukprot:2647429-Pleurochrysis_carterae.AAC.2
MTTKARTSKARCLQRHIGTKRRKEQCLLQGRFQAKKTSRATPEPDLNTFFYSLYGNNARSALSRFRAFTFDNNPINNIKNKASSHGRTSDTVYGALPLW